MKFCAYTDNGAITQIGLCSDDSPLSHIPGNKLKGIGDEVNNGTHYIFDGKAIRFPEKPSGFHSWNWETQEWRADAKLAETSVRTKRDARMAAFQWRIDRYNSEVRLGLPTTDDIAELDGYMQALRDITGQTGFPFNVIWRTAPQ